MSVASLTVMPFAASTMRRQARAHVSGRSWRNSGGELFMPPALESGILLEFSGASRHLVTFRRRGECLAVKRHRPELAFVPGRVAEDDGDDPLLGRRFPLRQTRGPKSWEMQ